MSTIKIFIQNEFFFNNFVYCFIVIVELKSKFERSLEDEKLEHAKTKEELNAIIQDEKQLRDKQNVDSMNRYNELEQNYEVLQVTNAYLFSKTGLIILKYLSKGFQF